MLIVVCAVGHAQEVQPVEIDYFYEAGCAECFKVNNHVIPELNERYEGFYRMNWYDVGVKTNIIRLATYQNALNIISNESVMMVVDYAYVFNGYSAIKGGLLAQVDDSIARRMDSDWEPLEPIAVEWNDVEMFHERLRGFTVAMVIGAGITDGINPCAIATLVFFMSLLAVSRVHGRGLLLMGVSFCLATFLTYTAIGFGLLRALHLLTGFEWGRFGLELVMMVFLSVFACLSFRDAYRYNISGKADAVTLQLPKRVKQKMHEVMRRGLGAKSLVIGGFLIGSAVTSLESVCTGQVYVPTLVMVIKAIPPTGSGHLALVAWRYLVVYNLFFLVPLVTVFLLTYFGLRTHALLDWSRRNVVFSKIVLGLFFVLMAILMAVL